MFEALVVATATTGLFALAKGFRGNERLRVGQQLITTKGDDHGEDLPCPWCYAPTDEHDSRCAGCGRSFG